MNQKKETMWRLIKFTLFSVSAGIIQIGSFALLHDALGMRPYWIPYLISLVLSVLWNYTFNRKYTFRSNDDVRRGMLLVALYYLVFTPVSTWGGQLLSNAGVHDWLVQGINMP